MLKIVAWTHDENFGDMLGPTLIEKISTQKVKEKGATLGLKGAIMSVGSRIKRFRHHPFSQPVWPWERNLIISIGSIMKFANRETTVWGTGCISPYDIKYIKGIKDVRAVRGPLSAKLLAQNGLPTTNIYGDPALLLPLIYPPSNKTTRFGIIPHYSEYNVIKDTIPLNSSLLCIDMGTKNVSKVIKEITSCEYTFSTSLHGLITSHAYGIPSLWIKKHNLIGGSFKFHDYFLSVGIPIYDGIDISNLDIHSENNMHALIRKYNDYILPHKNLDNIRKEILKCAPFDLKESFNIFYR